MKRVRDCSLSTGVPVILVAHLRKRDRTRKAVVPDVDDFHGSSDITKIATACVLVAAAPKDPTCAPLPWVWPTYMHVAKDRMEGSTTRYIAQTAFDARSAGYREEYLLGRAVGERWEELPTAEWPRWARKGRGA